MQRGDVALGNGGMAGTKGQKIQKIMFPAIIMLKLEMAGLKIQRSKDPNVFPPYF